MLLPSAANLSSIEMNPLWQKDVEAIFARFWCGH